MINFFKEKKSTNCTICGLKVSEFYKIVAHKKDLDICKGCLNNLYIGMGEMLTPKSPESVLKNERRIIKEDFNETRE